MSRANPFIKGYPVSEDGTFFGRRDVLDLAGLIFCGAEPTGHLEISGPRRMGKSSLLHRIRRMVRECREDAVSVYWSSEESAPGGRIAFGDGLVGKLIHEAPELSATPISEGSPWKTFADLVADLVARGRRVFLFLDEFQGHVKRHRLRFEEFVWLRGLTQSPDTRVTLIISTLKSLHEYPPNYVSSGLPHVFAHREFLGPLDRDAALRMVTEPAARAGIGFPPRVAERLFELCGGHPCLTSYCASDLAHLAIQGQPLEVESPEFLKVCSDAVSHDLALLARRLPEDQHDEIRRLVNKQFAGTHGAVSQLSEPAKALLRSGLCYFDSERLRPTGALCTIFLRSRFNPASADLPASHQEIADFHELLGGIEESLRRYVDARMVERVAPGANWEDDPRLCPTRIAQQAKGRSRGRGLMQGLTFGELLGLAERIESPADFREAIADCVRAQVNRLRVESGAVHPSDQGPPPSSRLAQARNALQRLRKFLDQAGY